MNDLVNIRLQKHKKHWYKTPYQDLDDSGNTRRKLLNKYDKSLPTLIKIYEIKHNSAIITN